MDDDSSNGDISPTNTGCIETSALRSNNMQPAINELVMKLSSQTLSSSNTPTQCSRKTSPYPTKYLDSPVEDINAEISSLPTTERDIDPSWEYPPTPHRNQEMLHPNLFSSFFPQGADSCRTQRQIFQERQCRPAFTRDLQQLLEEMIQNGDQCRLSMAIISSPPPSRGRDRGFSTSSLGTPVSPKSPLEITHEDEGFCENDESSMPYVSALNTPSTTALYSTTASTHSLHSAPDSRRNSRHRRVASEGNIELDFDAHDAAACSLRRAGAPVGVAKMGRQRGRGNVNINRVVEWRKNVPKLRKSRKEMFKRRAT